MEVVDRLKIEQTVDILRSLFKAKGYKFFEQGDYNLNLIGVRGDNIPDRFNDEMLVLFKVKGEWVLFNFPITTYPGVYWLRSPMTKEGCAIMKEGQYSRAYQIGPHFNITALVQTGNKVKVYRDNSKDSTITLIEDSIIEGYFGINIHPVMDRDNNTIGQDSAGCQVLKNFEDFSILMSLVKKASSLYGNSFTYTLINKEELCKV